MGLMTDSFILRATWSEVYVRFHYIPKLAPLKTGRAERRDALISRGEKLGRRGAPPSRFYLTLGVEGICRARLMSGFPSFRRRICLLIAGLLFTAFGSVAAQVIDCDICVFGGTSAGVAAAV